MKLCHYHRFDVSYFWISLNGAVNEIIILFDNSRPRRNKPLQLSHQNVYVDIDEAIIV